MPKLNFIQMLCVWALPLIFAITAHEAAHGWVANKLGDRTARMLGRVTLNPLKHIDMIGTVLVPAVLLFFGGFIFGWAKPVPIDWRNLKNIRRDAALVAVAGPCSNLLMAIFWAGIAKLGTLLIHQGLQSAVFLIYVGMAGISINLMLGLLNLIPIPPLDGSRVVSALLPPRLSIQYESIQSYGFMILLVLIFTGILTFILQPPYVLLQNLIYRVFSI